MKNFHNHSHLRNACCIHHHKVLAYIPFHYYCRFSGILPYLFSLYNVCCINHCKMMQFSLAFVIKNWCKPYIILFVANVLSRFCYPSSRCVGENMGDVNNLLVLVLRCIENRKLKFFVNIHLSLPSISIIVAWKMYINKIVFCYDAKIVAFNIIYTWGQKGLWIIALFQINFSRVISAFFLSRWVDATVARWSILWTKLGKWRSQMNLWLL